MKFANKFLAGAAALSLMAGGAYAQSKTTADGSDDPTGFVRDAQSDATTMPSPSTPSKTTADGSDDAGGFVRDAQSEATEMPAMTTQGNPLMDKTVVTSDGEVVGVVGSVAPEAGNRERIYITRTEAMGGGIFSLVVPPNFVPEEQINIGMTAAEAKKQM
ncbi:hypothetical protein V8J36_09245 [Frigidibacter sp. MR17.14]|uniref:hypothetical protein n=1 Tax=Frigidibacter sp. MR17.14 TaxID=3126509 RepID=UPI003012F757